MDSSKIGFRLSYLETGSFFHRLSGVSKLILFIYWIFLTLLSFDLRILVAMLIMVYCFLALSRVPFRVYRPFVLILLVFVLFNAGVIFLFAPDQGDIYIGSRTVLLELNGRYDITRETLVYLAVVVCKYITVLPMALLFIFSTHPTEFSASLASVGVPYRFSYVVSLTLRYLPEITKDFRNILQSQQARGVEIGRKTAFFRRISNIGRILIPLIFSSLDRAESISNAMELRGFGKFEKRSWYNYRALSWRDILAFALMAAWLVLYIVLRLRLNGMFWYPFT